MKVRTKTSIFLLAASIIFGWQLVGVEQLKAQQKKQKVTQRALIQSRNDIFPVVDYHTHLLGPFALPMPEPLPPEVKLPPELERLLTERSRLVGNVATESDFKNIFTEDAQLLNARIAPTDWMRDKHWFMRYLNLWSKTDRYRFAPNHYAFSGETGYIAGTVVRESTKEHVWNFLLGIKKGADRLWRIAADSTTERKPPNYTKPLTADGLVKDLDEAGIKRAVVLSEAFWLGGPAGTNTTKRMIEAKDEATGVRGENDWTAQQVARYPNRLILACAVDPLKDYAIPELVRCARDLEAKAMKLNLSGLGFSFDNREQIEKLARFFKAANDNRIAIVIHLEPGHFYGPREVEIFLDRIVSVAPDITIQIAHLAGNGPGISSPEALAAFAEARAVKDPRTKNLYFDFAGLVDKEMSAKEAELMVTRMRQIGLDRVLYASDSQPGGIGNPPTAEQWALTRRKLPLTDAQLRIIANNIAPYIR
ncbi:MAG TPA: amidohydrolase family protein [Pyrinomonadaceae bacterium]|nr:amidohydrolase family protein [Pyrinomonadaceae bacterium]